jgi:tRNA threonylcarbamoyladenosine biosynthesis protein TsaE
VLPFIIPGCLFAQAENARVLRFYLFSATITLVMSMSVSWQTTATSAEETEKLAEKIGRALKGGEVIELVSDLGGGKTTFVRGLARGFGSHNKVASPTFTLSRVYESGDREMHHFDFYRLHEPGLIAEELVDVLGDHRNVVVVEWADLVKDVLPRRRLTINIEHIIEGRRLTFHCPDPLRYLMEAVS